MADKVQRDRGQLSLLAIEDLLEVLHLLLLVEVGQLVVGLVVILQVAVCVIMESLTADSSGEVHVLLEESHSVGMDGAQV